MSCLACAVVFCTVYALILPAITAENTPQCGQEEHVHTEDCYAAAESGRTLVCTPETLGVHQHTADCLGAEGEYVCGYANFVIHHHDTACYDASGVLWCPLPEVEEHTHSEACYQAADSAPAEPVHTHTEECYTTERGELICTLPEAEGHAHSAEAGCYDGTGTLICQVEESAGHQHTDQCYAQTQVLTCALPTEAEAPAAEPAQTEPTEPVLICGRPEIVLHQHGPACYDGTGALICGQVQVLAHQHTDDCFQAAEGAAEPVLTCQLEEHTHTAQCFLLEGLTEEEWAQVDSVNALLAALPGQEEIQGKMAELEEAGDEEGYDAYLTQLIQAVQEAQAAYDALTEAQREKVTGAQRLEDLAWLQANVLPEEPTNTIAVGETKEVEIPGKDPNLGMPLYLSVFFTPEYTHEYVFTIAHPEDYGYKLYYNIFLLDEAGQELLSYTRAEIGMYPKVIRATLEEGICYELKITRISGTSTNPALVSLDQGSNHDFSEYSEDGTQLVCTCGKTMSLSGTCGENVTWQFSNGVLTISGSGRMKDYSQKSAPWYLIQKHITSVVVESGVTSIGNYAFQNCTGLTSVSLPGSLMSIGSGAFGGCTGLTSITISDSVTSIGNYAFQNCTGLTSVSLPGSLMSIGSGAFSSCANLTSVSLPGSLTSIGSSAFSGCASLTSVTIPDSVTSIGDSTFYNCANLTSVSLPGSLTGIGDKTFCGCTKLKELRIPSGVTTINPSALAGCSNLGTIYWDAANAVFNAPVAAAPTSFRVILGDTVERFTQTELSTLISMGCTGLELPRSSWLTLTALKADFLPSPLASLDEAEGQYYVDAYGVLYRIEGGNAHLVCCPPEVTGTCTVPAALTAKDGATYPVVGVDSHAFQGAALTALIFAKPENITELKDFAFYNARNLASINGKTTADEVLATFTGNPQTGTGLFENTKIAVTVTSTTDAIVIEDQGKTLRLTIERPAAGQHPKHNDNSGVFRYYTGETAETSISISNLLSEGSNPAVVRVYYLLHGADGAFDNYEIGQEYDLEGTDAKLQVLSTSVPNCYCLQLSGLRAGATVNFKARSTYPSPSSGGSVTVWAKIFATLEDAAAQGTDLPPIDRSHTLLWETKPNDFTVTTNLRTSGSLQIIGNGEGGAYLNGLSYEIGVQQNNDPLPDNLGADYVKSVAFTDELILPEGAQFTETVRSAITTGNYTMVDGEKGGVSTDEKEFRLNDGTTFLILRIGVGSPSDGFNNCSVEINEAGNLQLHWQFRNRYTNTEIHSLFYYLQVMDNMVEFESASELHGVVTFPVTNSVTALQHFTYSEEATDSNSCSDNATPMGTGLRLSTSLREKYGNAVSYPGRLHSAVITAENPGIGDYTGLTKLEYCISEYMFLSTAQLAEAFQADRVDGIEDRLTVTISSATLCTPLTKPRRVVTGIDGRATGITVGQQDTAALNDYSGMEDEDSNIVTKEATLTLAWTEEGDQLRITASGEIGGLPPSQTCEPTEAGIQEALENLGYLVTNRTCFTLRWDLPAGYVLAGGTKIEKTLALNTKGTFTILQADALGTVRDFSVDKFDCINVANAYGTDNHTAATAYVTWTYWVEYFTVLDRRGFRGEEEITSATLLHANDVLDQQLNLYDLQYAEDVFGVTPLVDQMTGPQVLLVPKDLNVRADWAASAKEVTVGAVRYYSLEEPGCYEKVWTAQGQMADRVEVTKTADGLTTRTYWYFLDISGLRDATVTYKAQVRPDLSSSLTPSLSCESWLGDHETHRLYDGMVYPITIEFSKRIVPAVNDAETLGETHSMIEEGGSVVYRLRIDGVQTEQGDYRQLTVKGNDISDILPASMEECRWSKGTNVAVSYGEGCTVTNGDHWSVTEVNTESGRQSIEWGSDFELTFTNGANIYVTLTYPTGSDWENYAKAHGTGFGLSNTFCLKGVNDVVTHELRVQGRASLHKGVYGGGYQRGPTLYEDKAHFRFDESGMSGLQDARFYYSNRGVRDYGVLYYVTICNEGWSKMYLTEIQDRLPRGFTLDDCVYEPVRKIPGYSRPEINNLSGISSSYDSYILGVNVYTGDGEAANLVNARYSITPWQAEDGTQYATIQFSKCEKEDKVGNAIPYDAERGMCYLNPGQAIVVTYLCNTNDAADTDPLAENTIAMAYHDFSGKGLELGEGYTSVSYSTSYTPNDGDCRLESAAWARSMGFRVTDPDGTWLTSQVSVQRGEIKPGITKQLVSATGATDGTTTQNPTGVHSTDRLNWKITADNGGFRPITDYVLTDVMQAPYQFCESKTRADGYYIYEIRLNDVAGEDDRDRVAGRWSLFKPISWNADGSVTIEARFDSDTTATERTVNLNDVVTLTAHSEYLAPSLPFQLCFSKNTETGNLVMSLHLENGGFSIPTGGRGVLSLSTSPQNLLSNKQYRNTAYITPSGFQSWDGMPNHGNAAELTTPFFDGVSLPSARGSALATTSYGYVTTSFVSVTENGNLTNTALSTGDPNYIALSARDNEFTYTLTVNNALGDNGRTAAMEHLVLIDRLPKVGDHVPFDENEPRGSQFTVSLAEHLLPVVTVTPKNGTPQMLNPDQYTLEYSTETEFTPADWNGDSADKWSTVKMDGCRSVRLVINDPNGAAGLVPADSIVSLSFQCKVDDPTSVQPGQIAWNDFGYRYKMAGNGAYLESAPLPVGVKVPSVPKLVKKLVDHGGSPVTAELNESFNFLVYQGEALTGEYATSEALIAALDAAGTPYHEFTATVPAGASQSEPVTLVVSWTWVKGDRYTVVELLPADSNYSLRGFGAGEQQSYTFTYDPAVDQTVVCTNLSLVWDVELIKKGYASESGGSEDPVLPGAVFALYSPKVEDKITDEALAPFSDLDIEQTLLRDEKTWYLKAVDRTEADGKLGWTGLTQESYYLVEVKAPDGYLLPETPEWLLQRSDERDGVVEVEIRNSSGGYELPQAGGSGVYLQTFCGLTLMAGPLVCWTHKRRRGAEKR